MTAVETTAGARSGARSKEAKTAKRTGSNGFAPVGDIQVKKKAKTYNTYTLQLSMGQIEAIHSALEKDHANPIADELLALFGYYLQTVPGPGEEEEDVKAQDEQAAATAMKAKRSEDDLPSRCLPATRAMAAPPWQAKALKTCPASDRLPGRAVHPWQKRTSGRAPTSLPAVTMDMAEDDMCVFLAPPRE
jgi:hypothetical protein